MVLPKLKRHLNAKNTLSDHDSIHGHRNLNDTERSAIARHRNFNAPKICKITLSAACQYKKNHIHHWRFLTFHFHRHASPCLSLVLPFPLQGALGVVFHLGVCSDLLAAPTVWCALPAQSHVDDSRILPRRARRKHGMLPTVQTWNTFFFTIPMFNIRWSWVGPWFVPFEGF